MSLLIVGNGDMLLHQFNDPVNKNAQFAVDMAVRRKRQVQGHWADTPLCKLRNQSANSLMCCRHIDWQRNHA